MIEIVYGFGMLILYGFVAFLGGTAIVVPLLLGGFVAFVAIAILCDGIWSMGSGIRRAIRAWEDDPDVPF